MAVTTSTILELVWHDARAFAFAREADGTLAPPPLQAGADAVLELPALHAPARALTPGELAELAAAPPASAGDSARGLFAVAELARRSVSEGLVHPHLTEADGEWYALWAATLDAEVQATLARIAAALPSVAAAAFRGDRLATVQDAYAFLVDHAARTTLLARGVELAAPTGRVTAADAVLAALAAPDPELPPAAGYAGFARRLERWVDRGLAEPKQTPWRLALHLDERGDGGDLVVELWLHAGDDPSARLPVSLLWTGGADAFTFVRDRDPYADLEPQLAELRPLLAAHGVELDEDEPAEAPLAASAAARFLRRLTPELERRGTPVLLPSAWVRAPARLRANLRARNAELRPSSGLFSTRALADFDWRVAVGDVELDERELTELARSQNPVVEVDGRWHALSSADVARAVRFLQRRDQEGHGFVDLVRAVSGLETDAAGLALGDVELDQPLADLLDGEARFEPLPTPATMSHALFPFQERGHGWLRMLGDLGIGAILADDMGLGKTVQAIAMLVSEREDRAVGPTLVVCPMSVARQWVREVERFAPALRVHLHHGVERLHGEEFAERARASDVIVTSYDLVSRDLDDLQPVIWDRVLLDEAQDVKNPATARARALRLLRARRRVAMTGTPIENRLDELWALMDILNPGLLGSRELFARTFARPIEEEKDEGALQRLRSIVQPFILRRTKHDPEVELDLPPITVKKDYCRLTVEQATLYQATMDHWLPRIEAHGDRFGRRGAVLAMLSHLKQVCNHPEMLLATGRPLDGRSGKLERLVELLEQVPEGDKALVFTQYVRFERLVPYLRERLGKNVAFFHGHLNARERDELLASFSSPGGPTVLVISLRAGGRGLNLPAANHVFHFDRWWNPAVEQQATDRAHRVGQQKPVFVYSLITLGTLEERIDELLESKRELVEKVMGGRAESWLGDLDLDAIRAAVALAPESVEEDEEEEAA